MILTNGDCPSSALAQKEAAGNELFIAVDGASYSAKLLGLSPDIVCGDFDSLELAEAVKEFPNAEFVPATDQNLADLEKTILLAIERGAKDITVLGATGGRLDHTLGNLATLQRFSSSVQISFQEDRGAFYSLSAPKTQKFSVEIGDTVSLVAFQQGTIVSISGTEWELCEHALPAGTQGVSNRAKSNLVEVQVSKGSVFVLILKLP